MGKKPSMEQRCNMHPTHKQSKGVCPSCLRKKLSQISTSSSSSTTNHSGSSTCSSDLSPYDSSDSNISSVAIGSPLRKITKTMSFSCILIGEVGKPLKKSRSLAFVVEEEDKKKEKNKKWFWSKLLGRRKEEKDIGLFPYSKSKTLKEMSSSTKWGLFAKLINN